MNCPSCGHENSAHAKFCEECGVRLGTEAPASLPAESPQSYTPRHLADRILRTRSALEGERKQVTVLFADVKGSMTLAEEVDPEEWHRILNRFFAILGDGIHRFEGTINQYTGDGIMALFGAPIAHEDHASRACYSALALRTELRRYAEDLKRSRGMNFSVRMGLHSGEVVVGKIGDDLRMDYTAQGHTVGLAQRMEQLAAPGTAYLTGSTAKLVEGFMKLRDLGTFEIRGVADPVQAFELEDVGALRTRFDLSKTRGLSVFVGRANEMELLEEKLERSLAGEAQIVSLIGEAGVGKSRLSFEFLERCRARGIRVAEGHALSHGQSVPLLPWLSVFRSSFDVDERDDAAKAREKVAGRAVLWDPMLSELLPIVFDFMGIADPEAPTIEMDPALRKRKLLDFVCRASEARNRTQGGILLWEDLHWLDAASDEMLAGWLAAVAGTRTLVVTNYRPEYRGRWSSWENHTEVRLGPLKSREVHTLLTELLGSDHTVYALPRMIEERTRGNPFFIQEVVQSLIESGDLRGKRGSYKLETAVRSLAIPGSVRAVLAARIDRLPDDQKSLLQTASVLGKTFEEPVLEKATGLPRSQLAAPLASLQSAEMILEDALYPVRRFAFKHPLTQEVAYHSQLQDRRAKTHLAAARALADLHSDQLSEKAALLAHHFEQGGKALEAARFHARAALWVGTKDIPEALRHDRRVVELLERISPSDETMTLGVKARARLLQLAWRSGMEPEEEDRLYREGAALAERLANEGLRATVAVGFEICLGNRGDEDGRERLGRETYQRALSLGDRELTLITLVPLANSLLERGKLADAMRLLETHDADLEPTTTDRGFGEFSARTHLLGLRAQAHAGLGNFETAEIGAADAMERGVRDGRAESEMLAHLTASEVHLRAGDADRATEHGLRFLELAERHGAPTYVTLAHSSAARARTLAGDAEAAIEHARVAGGTILAYGLEGLRPWQGEALATALLAGGSVDAAETGRATAELCRRTGQTTAGALCMLVVAATTEFPEARRLLDGADQRLRGAGARGYLPLVLEARAELARRRDDPARVRAHYREANQAWSEMGAHGHAERTRRLLDET
ncbi:MAG: adenylate/guanylate cyclase domain-containing protein [Candidatus Binatia bacterium]|nr:adenylate/guanylate cyclase domain-containing protein [Candidatus Binatia bacterium]